MKIYLAVRRNPRPFTIAILSRLPGIESLAANV
jgi:hypothetical protein